LHTLNLLRFNAATDLVRDFNRTGR